MEQNSIYKQQIIDFIEGRLQPDEFDAWLKNNPQALDWLQSMIADDKTMQKYAEEKIYYFLKALPAEKYEEIINEYRSLCCSIETGSDEQMICAKKGLKEGLKRL